MAAAQHGCEQQWPSSYSEKPGFAAGFRGKRVSGDKICGAVAASSIFLTCDFPGELANWMFAVQSLPDTLPRKSCRCKNGYRLVSSARNKDLCSAIACHCKTPREVFAAANKAVVCSCKSMVICSNSALKVDHSIMCSCYSSSTMPELASWVP